ncbi:MAG: hypothetical protein DMF63_11760 [Acidobacteria bacterium]|nr:MAG: hypothetical protein DMF63_11760 [Acidobacteriota bacterium]
MKSSLIVILIVFILAVSAPTQTSRKSRHPGIQLFEQAKFSEAIIAFETATKTEESKSNPEIWNYLGLSYLAKDKLKEARKAFEKSVDLQPKSSIFQSNLAYAYFLSHQLKKASDAANAAIKLDARNPDPYQVRASVNLWNHNLDSAERDVDAFIQLAPTNPQGYIIKSDILLADLSAKFMSGKTVREEIDLLKRASQTLGTGKAKCNGNDRCADLEREYGSVNAFYEYFLRDGSSPPLIPDQPNAPQPGVTPVKILYQPKANYTDEARYVNVQGAVRVAILLGATGKVEQIMFLSKLGFGLDQEVLKAAKAIKFEPKTVDGKATSTVIVREYTFSTY